MRRRDFIALLGGTATTAWPLGGRAQQAGARARRVGVLFGLAENDPKGQRDAAIFRQELAKLGWAEGRNLRIDFRFAAELGPSKAAMAELLRLAPDVVYVWGGATTRAARQLTQTVPIVFTGPSTPVEDVNVA